MVTPTRQRLVEAAIRRFYRDGFRSVGISQILADVGISKTAFYKHFESKEDLMLAALEMQGLRLQELHAMIRAEGGPSAVGRLYALFDVIENILNSDDFHGCIFVNVAMEFPLLHEPAHVLASRIKQTLEDIVCGLATEAAADDPRAMAQELCLIIEGTYITKVVTGDKRTIEIARRLAHLVIAARCPAAAVS